MLLIDDRMLGSPKHSLHSTLESYLNGLELLMQIPIEIRECVCFVGYLNANGEHGIAGTGFYVYKPESNANYIITARHCIEGIVKKLGLDKIFLRINTTGSFEWIETAPSSWLFHPDDQVDVAAFFICGWPFKDLNRSCFIAQNSFLLPSQYGLERWNFDGDPIRPGDDVFLTGLFKHHYGEHRNIPIMRVGSIAAMPEEYVFVEEGKIEAYLIEVRSLHGLSGSPVFIHRTKSIFTADEGLSGVLMPINKTRVTFALMGMIHGHYDSKPDKDDKNNKQTEIINSGIAIVIPAHKIKETIERKEFLEMEKDKLNSEARKKSSSVSQDSCIDDSDNPPRNKPWHASNGLTSQNLIRTNCANR